MSVSVSEATSVLSGIKINVKLLKAFLLFNEYPVDTGIWMVYKNVKEGFPHPRFVQNKYSGTHRVIVSCVLFHN